jgi:hypothetical protein
MGPPTNPVRFIASDGSFIKADTHSAGNVSAIRLRALDQNRVATAVRIDGGGLKVIVWDIASGGAIQRRGSDVPSGNFRHDVAVASLGAYAELNTQIAPYQIAAAGIRESNSELRIITWNVTTSGDLHLTTDVDMEPVKEISLTPLGTGIHHTSGLGQSTPLYELGGAAVDENGRLRMISWRAAYD